LLIAAGCLEDAKHSYELCQTIANSYCTIGVHPCRAGEPFDKSKYSSVHEYFSLMEQ